MKSWLHLMSKTANNIQLLWIALWNKVILQIRRVNIYVKRKGKVLRVIVFWGAPVSVPTSRPRSLSGFECWGWIPAFLESRFGIIFCLVCCEAFPCQVIRAASNSFWKSAHIVDVRERPHLSLHNNSAAAAAFSHEARMLRVAFCLLCV